MITVKIEVDPHVAEYIRGKFFDVEVGAVRFPSNSDIYVLLYDLLQKRPLDNPVDRGNLALALPDRREANFAGGKSPEQYNFISHRSAKILNRNMSVMMWAELHDYMDENKHLRGIQFNESVFLFMTRYGIDSISEDALLKNYQRWRDRMRKRKKRVYIRKK